MFTAFSRRAGAMLEAGARNMIDVPSPPAGQDRFDAHVAFSRDFIRQMRPTDLQFVWHCGIDTGCAGEHYRNSVAEDGRGMADESRRHT
jgi:hypothetical protein